MLRSFRCAFLLSGLFIVCLPDTSFAARDASFMDPGLNSKGRGGAVEAITIEPKSEIDTGESIINISRRITLFFANNTTAPIGVVSLVASGDGNVKSVIVSDDCSKESRISPSSRCSVVVEVTPTSPGSWTAEILMTHDGVGRIARAKLTGKTTVNVNSEKKDAGLSLSTKDMKPVDFDKVEIGETRSVRSALMINDSAETITLLSIDVIAAENGLERLDQGCTLDMDLKPGESCPVTLVWKPIFKGQISTDLIIRHSGKLGFAVIPIRGIAEGLDNVDNGAPKGDNKENKGKSDTGKAPQLTADELKNISSDDIPPLSADLLPSGVTSSSSNSASVSEESQDFHLIGTVGNRVVLLKPDGNTTVVDIGEEIPYGNGKLAKITNVQSREVEIFMDGKKKRLVLEAATALINKANKAKSGDSESLKTNGDKQKSSKHSPGSKNKGTR